MMKAVYCSNFNKILVLFHFYSILNDEKKNLITLLQLQLFIWLYRAWFRFVSILKFGLVFLPFRLTVYRFTRPEFKSTFTVHGVICIISNGRQSHRMFMYNFCVTCLFKIFNFLILYLFIYNCTKIHENSFHMHIA